MGKTHFFIVFHQDRETGAGPPGQEPLPRPPPWDWVEAVKRRGSQAAPVTVTLRVRSQHCDCLIHTYFSDSNCALVLDMSLARALQGSFRSRDKGNVGICCAVREGKFSYLWAEPVGARSWSSFSSVSFFSPSGRTCHVVFSVCVFLILHILYVACEMGKGVFTASEAK